MKSRYGMTAAALVLAASAAGCGTDPNAPAASPSVPSPFFAQVDGRWAGDATVQPLEGTLTGLGGCVQADANRRIAEQLAPNEKVVLTIEQERENLTANFAASSTGLSCAYTGRTSVRSLSLHAGDCEKRELVIRCTEESSDPFFPSRTALLVGSTLDAAYDPAAQAITGTAAHTYNVYLGEDDIPDAGIIVRYNYRLKKQ